MIKLKPHCKLNQILPEETEVMKKHALIITHAFPPILAVATYRPLRMTKALEQAGWSVSVITVFPANVRFRERSDALLEHISPNTEVVRVADSVSQRMWLEKSKVLGRLRLLPVARKVVKGLLQVKTKILYPKSFKSFNSLKRSYGASFSQFDMAWLCPALKEGLKIHERKPLTAILATVPPFVSSSLAYELSREINVPYVLDYRDLYVGNPMGDPSPADANMESVFIDSASQIIAVAKGAVQSLESRTSTPVSYLPNGFDQNLFSKYLNRDTDNATGRLSLIHAGTLYEGFGLSALIEGLEGIDSSDYCLKLAGSIDLATRQSAEGSSASVQILGTVQSDEALELVSASDVSIAVGASESDRGIIRAKIFEMMALRTPSIYVGSPDDEGALLLKESGLLVGSATNAEELKAIVESLIAAKKEGRALCQPKEDIISRYELQVQGPALVGIIEAVAEETLA